MSIFDFFRSQRHTSAATAKQRLQIIVAQQRQRLTDPDYLPLLQKELMAVVAKYISVEEQQVRVELERNGDQSVLELNITLPGGACEGGETDPP